MSFRFALVVPLVLLAGCTFEHRLDGGYPRHDDNGPDPMQRRYDLADETVSPSRALAVEPLDGAATGGGATTGTEAPDAMVADPTAPSPTGSTAIGVGSATGDGAATGRGPAVPGTTGNPSAP